MQITLMQGILLAIMTIIVGLDFFLEAFFVFRPLMVSTFTGSAYPRYGKQDPSGFVGRIRC